MELSNMSVGLKPNYFTLELRDEVEDIYNKPSTSNNTNEHLTLGNINDTMKNKLI